MEQEIITWIHPISGETEEVIKEGPRYIELKQKMNEVGFWSDDDPDKPEGCMTHEEFCKYLDQRKAMTADELLEEYNNRKNNSK